LIARVVSLALAPAQRVISLANAPVSAVASQIGSIAEGTSSGEEGEAAPAAEGA
jgi:large subunit ribosomal protein L10